MLLTNISSTTLFCLFMLKMRVASLIIDLDCGDFWFLREFIDWQEIAKTSEHIASKSIFLWKVNYRAVLHRVLDDLYHAATNLCLRHAHEIRKEQEVMVSSLENLLVLATVILFYFIFLSLEVMHCKGT